MALHNLRTDIKPNRNKIQSNFENLTSIPAIYIIPNKTTAERTALAATAGLKVYDTDLFALFIGNGSNWMEV